MSKTYEAYERAEKEYQKNLPKPFYKFQKPILTFLSGVDFKSKIMAAVAVFISVPTIAYLYGNVARSLMKLIRME